MSIKSENIKATLKATKQRRKSQTCRVCEIKGDKSRLSSAMRIALSQLFREAKWFWNAPSPPNPSRRTHPPEERDSQSGRQPPEQVIPKDLTLHDQWWTCPNCHTRHNRHTNAALNMLPGSERSSTSAESRFSATRLLEETAKFSSFGVRVRLLVETDNSSRETGSPRL